MYDSISRGDDPHVEHYKQLHQPCQEFSRCNWPFDAVLFHGLQYWVIFRHIWHQGLWLPVLHQLLFFLHTNTHRSWHTSFQSLTNFSFSFFLHKVANILALLLQVPPPPSCHHCHTHTHMHTHLHKHTLPPPPPPPPHTHINTYIKTYTKYTCTHTCTPTHTHHTHT